VVEHRAASRMRAVLKAEIRYNDGLLSTPCVVRDISDTGARLELPGEIALPDHFELYIEKRNQTRRVTLKWRHGKEIGVAFDDAAAAKPPAATDVSLEERVARLEAQVAELRGLLEKITAAVDGRQ
jgi:uncharacterized protein YceH (UPF0502 family)